MQSLSIFYWDGSSQSLVQTLQLNIVSGPSAVSAAHSSVEGEGLQGAVAGQTGKYMPQAMQSAQALRCRAGKSCLSWRSQSYLASALETAPFSSYSEAAFSDCPQGSLAFKSA